MKTQPAVAAGLIVLSVQTAFACSSAATKIDSASAPSSTVSTISTVMKLQPERTWGKGTPATADGADRIVHLSSPMRWVSVTYGERVKFNTVDANGAQQSFAWRFDVSPARSFVDLDDVAPAAFPVRGVRVFVAEVPQYDNPKGHVR
jgi:hypothetical protein